MSAPAVPAFDGPSCDGVLLDLPARTKAEVLDRVADHVATRLGRDRAEIAAVLGERERLGSTGVGTGIALPHADLPGLDRPIAVFARPARPIDWEAIDDRPVVLVVAVLSPPAGRVRSLDLLAAHARALRNETTRRRLLAATDVAEVVAAMSGAPAPPDRAGETKPEDAVAPRPTP